jgi:hypothetical protein
MERSTIPNHFRTFVAWYRRLLLLTRAMRRAGVWLTPRVSMALVLVMSLELVWVVVMPGRSDRVMVPAAIGLSTQVGYFYRHPPPWPRGNCFRISSVPRWLGALLGPQKTQRWVCNMHAENFSSIVQRLNLRAVEIEPIDQRCCMITDSRIPREWLLEKPCALCFRGPEGEDLMRRHPEHFRTTLTP